MTTKPNNVNPELQRILDAAVERSRTNSTGEIATYIPELANVDPERVSASILMNDGTQYNSGDFEHHRFTLQSVAKLVVLIGLIEEFGEDTIFSWINAEPSGQSFSSIAQLDRFGPVPSNPMVNAGAIALCGRIPGDVQARAAWLDGWVEKLFGRRLEVNGKVFASERATGNRNKSIAYLMKSNNVILLSVDEVLETYYYLCSYESDIQTAVYIATLLANGGCKPTGERVLREKTCHTVLSIMATCGLYDESGIRLVRYGLPAKSAVSGVIVASAIGVAGLAVCSPRLNSKAGSVRAHMILEDVSKAMNWHFGSPNNQIPQ